MKSLTKPTRSTLDKAVAHLAKQGADRYFFDRLNNPDWVAPLYERGYFRKPPGAIRNLEEGTIAYPDWPELRFLLRMAPQCPETVGKIVVDMPETDNVSVHELLVQIGLSIPREASAELADEAVEWLESPLSRLRSGEHFARFVAHLAEQGEMKRSKRLATRLFGSKAGGRPLRSATDAWYFERNLKICLPSLRRTSGTDCLALLCGLLRETLDPEERNEVEDYSYIWRRDLETANHSVKEVKDVLIDAIRDSAALLAHDPAVGFRAVREILHPGKLPILRRIDVYVATQVCDPSDPYVTELLFDPILVDRMTYRSEYARLLEAFYPRLPHGEQRRLLAFLTTDYLRSIPEERRSSLSDDKANSLSKMIERNRLVAFGSSIPAELTARRNELVAELGESREGLATAVWAGPTSPLTDEQLGKMSLEQIVEYVRKWQPEDDFDAPRPEGLSRALQNQVKARLEEFAAGAALFVGLPPTYVRGVITGLADAMAANQGFDWTGVLSLVTWVCKQPPDEQLPEREIPEDVDPGWTWTRQTIARLVERGLTHDESGLSLDHRPIIWSVIESLLQDPDPTPDSERATSETEALTRSINSVRGLALHAVLRYQWWVHKGFKSGGEGQGAPSTLELFPEVIKALEGSVEDPTAAVRCVFGEYFPTLFYFDAKWATLYIDAIFPESDELLRYWVATWGTFVEYAQPYDGAFRALRSRYDLALDRLQAADAVRRKRMGERGLGQHLSSYFWRSVDGQRSLETLLRYFDVCSPESAGHTMWFLARGLAEVQNIPDATLANLKSLWTQLSARAARWNEQKRRELHRHFGTWFTSPHFEGAWALGALEKSLATGTGLIDLQEVLVRLDSLARDHPMEVSACLEQLVRDEQQLLRPLLWEAELGAVLKTLLTSPHPEVRHRAGKLVDLLVENGVLFARELVAKRHAD
jgi:hypothetical protein